LKGEPQHDMALSMAVALALPVVSGLTPGDRAASYQPDRRRPVSHSSGRHWL